MSLLIPAPNWKTRCLEFPCCCCLCQMSGRWTTELGYSDRCQAPGRSAPADPALQDRTVYFPTPTAADTRKRKGDRLKWSRCRSDQVQRTEWSVASADPACSWELSQDRLFVRAPDTP